MSDCDFGWDTESVAPAKPRGPLPNGTYTVEIIETMTKKTRAGGQMVTFVFEVLEGEFRGRRVYENLNVCNANVNVQARARADVSAIIAACGLRKATNPDELLRTPMTIKLAQRKNKESGDMEQTVLGYEIATDNGGGNTQYTPPPPPAPRAYAPEPVEGDDGNEEDAPWS
jgi:Protein of unknown function (DUF669).